MTWVSVNKSMPDNTQRVLILGEDCLYPIIAIYLDAFEFNSNSYKSGFYLWDGVEPLDDVAYWCEIPEFNEDS